MPLLDLPLDELHTYAGRNPRPADHAAYWDRALAEMRAVDPDVELRSAEFTAPFADCFDLYFTGVRGARLHSKLVQPKLLPGPNQGKGLVQFHGYTGDAGDWMGLIPWAAAGFTLAALDCRGQGGTSEDPGGVAGNTHHGHIIRGLDADPSGEDLYYRQVFLDAAQLAGLVMNFEQVNENRVGTLGGSQGGGLALACAALEPRIKRTVAQYPFLCDYQRVWEMDQATTAFKELVQFFRMTDPTHERKAEWFTRLGYIDVQHLADRIEADVLMGVGLMDAVVPPSTQFAAYNKITSPKDVVVYPDFKHERLPGFFDRGFEFLGGV
ncbi:MAG: acetylxylan esterase [Planctomycetota bacterium]